MPKVLRTRTLALQFDLAEFTEGAVEGAAFVWKKTLGSEKFYTDLKKKIEAEIIADFNSQDDITFVEYSNSNDHTDRVRNKVKDAISSHAATAGQNALEAYAFREDKLNLEETLGDIKEYFQTSKAGIWLDENQRSLMVIVSVLAIGSSYAAYTLRSTVPVRRAIELIHVDRKVHVGFVELNGSIRDIDISDRTVKLSGGAKLSYDRISLNGRANGVYDYQKNRFVRSDIDAEVVFPINDNLEVNAGLEYRTGMTADGRGQRNRPGSTMNVGVRYQADTLSLECSVSRENSGKSASCSAEIKF